LSVIAFIAFALLRSYTQAKSQQHTANERAAKRAMFAGEQRIPSWVADKDEGDIFLNGIQKLAMHRGVPEQFILTVLDDKEIFKTFIYFAGAMESNGASFIEQQASVSDKLVELWERSSSKHGAKVKKKRNYPPAPKPDSPEYLDWANREGRWEGQKD
jgi:hypothetical protein